MRELLFKLKQAGLSCDFRDGGIIVTLSNSSIVVGQDAENFMAYVQEDLDFGPKHTAFDNLSQEQVIELCQSYVQPIATDRPELV